jgi:hypothetical protein
MKQDKAFRPTRDMMAYWVAMRNPIVNARRLGELMPQERLAKTVPIPSMLEGFQNPTTRQAPPINSHAAQSVEPGDLRRLGQKLGLGSIVRGKPVGYRSDIDALQMDSIGLTATAIIERFMPKLTQKHGRAIGLYLKKGILPDDEKGLAAGLVFAQLAQKGIDGAFYNLRLSRELVQMSDKKMELRLVFNEVLELQLKFLQIIYAKPEELADAKKEI